MKQVYVLRHGEKDSSGNLTQFGKDSAVLLRGHLPQFKIVIASPSPRTQETALLLSGITPHREARAGYFETSKETSNEIMKQAASHPFGFAGAYLSNSEIKPQVNNNASRFIELIYETLERLRSEESALIVSHEITIVPAANLLLKNSEIYSFPYLSGFVIDENKNLTFYSP